MRSKEAIPREEDMNQTIDAFTKGLLETCKANVANCHPMAMDEEMKGFIEELYSMGYIKFGTYAEFINNFKAVTWAHCDDCKESTDRWKISWEAFMKKWKAELIKKSPDSCKG